MEFTQNTYKSRYSITIICLNIALSSFYFGYTLIQFGTLPFKTLYGIYYTTLQLNTAKGLLNGCIPIGGLLGTLLSKYMLQKLSRRQCILATNAIAFFLGILQFIQSFELLLIVRLCQGVCVGIYSVLAPLVIKELAPLNIKGTLVSLVQLLICTGIFFGYLSTYVLKKITGDQSGRSFMNLVFIVPEIFIVIQTLILTFVFPYQTPIYWLSINSLERSRELIKIFYKEEYVEKVLLQIKQDLRMHQSLSKDPNLQNQKQSHLDSRVGWATLILSIHLAIMQQFSGINAVMVYGVDIASKTVSIQIAQLIPTLINFQQIIATSLTVYLLARIGRRTILLYGSFLQGISCFIITIGFYLNHSSSLKNIGQILIILGMFVFVAVFSMSLGPVVWLYIEDILPPQGVPIATSANWLSATLVIILFPIIVDNVLAGRPDALFLFFTFWCFGSFLANYKYLIQTKDKTQLQIYEEIKLLLSN